MEVFKVQGDIMNSNSFRKVILLLLTAAVMASCATTGKSITLAEEKIEYAFTKELHAEIISVKHGMTEIKSGGTYYSVINKSDVAMEVKVSVMNVGNETKTYRTPASFELLIKNAAGDLEFIKYTKPDEFVGLGTAKYDEVEIRPGKSDTDSIFFIYPGESEPLAIVLNKVQPTFLISPEDENYVQAEEYINSSSVIERVFQMAMVMDFKIIKEFMDQNNIDINQKNTVGLSLLTLGIITENNRLVSDVLDAGAILYDPLYYKGSPIMPIHLAVFLHNKEIVETLIARGANINFQNNDIEHVGAIAIRKKDYDTLRFLKTMGVNLTKVKVRMAMSPSMSAVDYAKQKDLPLVLSIIQSTSSF